MIRIVSVNTYLWSIKLNSKKWGTARIESPHELHSIVSLGRFKLLLGTRAARYCLFLDF